MDNKIIKETTLNDKIVFLGDYVDRGTQSKEVINFCYSLLNNNQIIFLLGNHDIAFVNSIINAVDFDLSAIEWLSQNSIETLQSYQIDCSEIEHLTIDDLLNLKTKLDIKKRFFYLLKDLNLFRESNDFKNLKNFILNCQLYYETQDYIFSHSGGLHFLKPEENTLEQWIWSRDFQKRKFNNKTYVVGHTPTLNGEIEYLDSNIIKCDTGSVFNNKKLPFIKLKENN